MNLLSPTDRSTIEACVFDGSCLPSYEWVRGCLIWPDERPDSVLGMHGFGYELLGDLWTGRGLIHRGCQSSDGGHLVGKNFWRLGMSVYLVACVGSVSAGLA
jgi:hypothetical protein